VEALPFSFFDSRDAGMATSDRRLGINVLFDALRVEGDRDEGCAESTIPYVFLPLVEAVFVGDTGSDTTALSRSMSD